MLNAIAGADSKDSTCLNDPISKDWCLESPPASLKGVKIGVPDEYHVKETPQDILDVWDRGLAWMEEAGTYFIFHLFF